MTNLCLVCERPVIEHTAIKNVHYCNNYRCPRLGVLSVFVLVPEKPKGDEKPKEPVVLPMKAEEVKKDDKDIPKS